VIELKSNRHVQALAYQIQKEDNSCNGDSYFIKATEEYFICDVYENKSDDLIYIVGELFSYKLFN
jgi:negative regulator of sigma-B (phosphoserine phosphatase)